MKFHRQTDLKVLYNFLIINLLRKNRLGQLNHTNSSTARATGQQTLG